MDPLEIREERFSSATPATPATPVPPAGGYSRYSLRTVYPAAHRAVQLVWFVAGVMNAILALDFGLRLLKANATGFVDLIYGLAAPLASPFDGIFGETITRTSLTARWADLVAIAIYSLVAWGIDRLIRIAAGRSAPAPPAAY